MSGNWEPIRVNYVYDACRPVGTLEIMANLILRTKVRSYLPVVPSGRKRSRLHSFKNGSTIEKESDH